MNQFRDKKINGEIIATITVKYVLFQGKADQPLNHFHI